MNPFILSIGTSVPPHAINQLNLAENMANKFALKQNWRERLHKIYSATQIKKRYSVIPDYQNPQIIGTLYDDSYPKNDPSSSQRNAIYKIEAPKLALAAAQNAIDDWGGNVNELTHIISISCTGMMAPGIEFHLTNELKLNRTIQRLGINFMGCFAAFQGIATARAYAMQNPKNRVLLVCTELCSLHMQKTLNMETFVANALFSDGAAAAIIGSNPNQNETPIWEILSQNSLAMDNSLKEMTWEIGDHGFVMTLSSEVPRQVKRHLKDFAQTILGDKASSSECDWLVHPGGKAILEAVTETFDLDSAKDLKSSWEVLEHYGNMSSATFLFVMDHKRKCVIADKNKPLSIGLAFGPGLTLEGLLLKNVY